ncbi:MAG: GtrA family protein [Anaerolineae bacterium]|nr:GtrA family protein [Anaerolineae bacterium]
MEKMSPIQAWINEHRQELTRFLKFAVVGAIGAVVDFGILYLLHRVVGWNIVLSNTLSFTCAVISNFTWNRYWTYPDSRSKPIVSQLGQFFVVNILGWAINTGLLSLLRLPLTGLTQSLFTSIDPELAYTIGYNGAKVIATGVVMFWNFFINRLWTYNDVE